MAKSRKQNKVIGFDLDGVIIDHTENKLRVAKDLGVLLDIMETPTDVLNSRLGREVARQIDKIIYDEPHIALTPPLSSGAKIAISHVSKLWPYYLISRRTADERALELLQARGLWPEYFDEKNTFFVQTKDDKNTKAKELGINIYIDDQPSVLEKLVDIEYKFLFDPLNVYPDGGDYIKVQSWRSFLSSLKSI